MKTIKNSKEITTLEVGDKVLFGDLEYKVIDSSWGGRYYLRADGQLCNSIIFKILNVNRENFIKNLGIDANFVDFPEVKSLEALTAIVSALFKEYEKQNELPKTWGEFCKKNPIKTGEYLINSASAICITNRSGDSRDAVIDKNYCVSKQDTEAFLALMQLRQLRKAYIKDWEPDWKNSTQWKANILNNGIEFVVAYFGSIIPSPLSFPTREMAKDFINCFEDLLNIAKPLI